jgi:hypothetical protein
MASKKNIFGKKIVHKLQSFYHFFLPLILLFLNSPPIKKSLY